MAQGNKLKTKAKLPDNVKQKNKAKGKTFNRRKNAPIAPKKGKFLEAQKLKQTVSKAVNQNIEDEMRKRAYEGSTKKENMSKAQELVVAHHSKKDEATMDE